MGWASSGTLNGSVLNNAAIFAVPEEGNAWFTTDWQTIGAGAPPSKAELQVIITGFPGKGLEIGKSYHVAIEVQSGAGVTALSAESLVTVVAETSKQRFIPRYKLKK
jgi:hypothetical protein